MVNIVPGAVVSGIGHRGRFVGHGQLLDHVARSSAEERRPVLCRLAGIAAKLLIDAGDYLLKTGNRSFRLCASVGILLALKRGRAIGL